MTDRMHEGRYQLFLQGICAICGKGPLKHLTVHAQNRHRMTNDEWRSYLGIPSRSEQMREAVKRNWASLSEYERRLKARGLLAYTPEQKSAHMKVAAKNRTPEQIAAYAARLNRTSAVRVKAQWAQLTSEQRAERTLPARLASPTYNGGPLPHEYMTPEERKANAARATAASARKRHARAEHRRATEAAFKIEQRAWMQGRDMTPDEKAQWRAHIRKAELLISNVSVTSSGSEARR